MKLIAFSGVPGAGKDAAATFLKETHSNVTVLKMAYPIQDVVALIDGCYDPDHYTHRKLFENHVWKNELLISLSDLKLDEEFFTQIVKVILGRHPFDTKFDIKNSFLTVKGEFSNQYFTGAVLLSLLRQYWGIILLQDSYTPRRLMQLIGTNLVRKMIHTGVWIAVADRALKELQSSNQSVLVTDLRFPNEANLIRQYGGSLVYITSKDAEENRRVAVRLELVSHESESYGDVLRQNADYVIDNDGTPDYFTKVLEVYNKVKSND